MEQAKLKGKNNICTLLEDSAAEGCLSKLTGKGMVGYQFDYLMHLVKKGGPDSDDYYELDACIAEIIEQIKNGEISESQLSEIRALLGDAFSNETIQEFLEV